VFMVTFEIRRIRGDLTIKRRARANFFFRKADLGKVRLAAIWLRSTMTFLHKMTNIVLYTCR